MSKLNHILSLTSPELIKLQKSIVSSEMNDIEATQACYNYVRDNILFGYNRSDDISAADVLKDGYGQCNTKSTLLMALLTLSGITVRIHGFKIDKKLQYGAITGFFYFMAPQKILHSWIEVNVNKKWINLEGFILDRVYIESLQTYFPADQNSLCGYGVASESFQNPKIDLIGASSTYIQQKGIVDDLGLFDTPADFYKKHGTNIKGIKKVLFQYLIRFIMNRNISLIRKKLKKGTLRVLCKLSDIDSIY